jgi:hypothetical protein
MEAAETSRRSLGEFFVERGLISQDDLERALAEQAVTNHRLADILVRRGLVTGRDITSALMEQLGSSAPPPTPAPAPEPPLAEVVALPAPPAEAVAEQAPGPAPISEPELAAFSVPEPSSEPSISAPALVARAASRRRAAEAELSSAREAHAQILRGLEQVRAELEARDLATDSLTRELDQTQALLRRHEEELAHEVARWEQAGHEAERCDAELAESQSLLEEKEQELSEASASAAVWASRASELDAETHALAGRFESAVQALESLAATLFAAEGADLTGQAVPASAPSRIHVPQTGALCFVPRAGGYDLIEREGELPAVGETLEFGEHAYVVTKIGRSPLPFDRRSCVFLTAV